MAPDSAARGVRTRFAPSPTGHLHIGGARTALFCYLYAKHLDGSFILRIEDTDKARNTEEARQAILDGLTWLGLQWDEGPFYQSKRGALYRTGIEQLLNTNRAYRCACPPELIDEKRKAAMAKGGRPMYDGTCRDKQITDPRCPIRFRAPDEGTTVVRDLIRGDIATPNEEIDDFIVQRSDGSPTYNFVVVMDDADMRISHVIRGDDHLNNTPKQIVLYEALGYALPHFAHLPLILGSDRQRLSKRHGATSVDAYRVEGFLPEAVNNFLVRLGWSHGDQEIFSMREMIEKFNLEAVGKASGVFNQEKLLWLNQHYMRAMDAGQFAAAARPFLQVGESLLGTPEWETMTIELQKRCNVLADVPKQAHYYFDEPQDFDAKAAHKALTIARRAPLAAFRARLAATVDYSEQNIEQLLGAYMEESGLPLKEIAPPLRVALTGTAVSPGIARLVHLVGKERTLKRIDRALQWIDQHSSNKEDVQT